LTPDSFDFQRFRIVTGAPVVVDWKSHPYRDTEVLEWWSRIEAVRAFYGNGGPEDCAIILGMAARYGVTHIVVRANATESGCTTETRRDEHYSVRQVLREVAVYSP